MTMDAVVEPTLSPSGNSKGAAGRRRAVLILGMHRSGTSALARMLNLLGCTLPRALMAGGEGNELGHWESDRVRYFNDDVLAAAGTEWNDWLPVNPGLAKSPLWSGFVERGRAVLADEFECDALFVLKDPRICRLTELWLEVLSAENIDAGIVIPVRNPLEVARSLRARNKIDEHYTLLMWLRHVLEAESSTRGRNRIFSSYEALLDDWEAVSARIGKGLQLAWPRVSPISAQEITDFLNADQRHHSTPDDRLYSDPAISPWVCEAFSIFQRWAENSESDKDYAALDAITSAFNTAAIAFARPLSTAIGRNRRTAELEMELDSARSSLHAAHADAGELRCTHERLVLERNAALAELAKSQSDLAAASSDLRAIDEQLTAATATATDVQYRLTITENRLNDHKSDAARAAVELEVARAESSLNFDLYKSLLQQVSCNQAESNTLRATVFEAQEELTMAHRQIAHHQLEIQRLRSRDETAAVAEASVKWFRDIYVAFSSQPPWWALLPRRWRQPHEHRRLEAKRLFSARGYLGRYPDVAAADIEPLRHYIMHGMDEGRTR